jgi:XTP/dITP diphosphohydrolase
VKLVLATNNPHKVQEIKAILHNLAWELISLSELHQNLVITEDGLTFEENARKKAETVMRQTGLISMGEDTGLEVDVLNGQPGIYSARFAGEKATYQQNVEKLLTLLKDVSLPNRTARFRCVCALAFPQSFNRKIQIFEGICKGKIIDKPHGQEGFGYDPIFVPDGFDKTFAELSQEEKNKISHRGKALSKVKKYLLKLNINSI